MHRRGGRSLHRPAETPYLVTPPTSVGQTDAAGAAAAGQDLAAVGGGHPLAEAMDLAALTLLGLIGTNHVGTPPVLILTGLRPSTTTPGSAGRGR